MQATSAGRRYHDIEYCRTGAKCLSLDGFVPDGPGPHPAAIIVHGGGWVAGDRRWNVEPLFATLEEAGLAWFSISYTLAGDVTQFGAAVDDVERAVAFVRERAAEYRIDPARLVLIGESAGGQLAAMAALRGAFGQVAAVVAFYAPMDLETAVSAFGAVPALALMQPRLRSLSPLRHVRRGLPPFLLIHGSADPLVPFSQSETMCRAIRAAGGVCDLVRVHAGVHGMRRWEAAGQTGYKRLMKDWLARHL